MTVQGLNSSDFRAALGSFATGVTIVTTTTPEGTDVGMTANSFNSVSLDPPMVLWSVGKNALSRSAFTGAAHFAVHVLAAGQEEMSNRFARRGEDKFAGLELERGPGGVPLLAGCAARFKCRTAYVYEGGDHDIIVGEVLEFDHFERAPLLFHRGKYSAIAPGTLGSAELAGAPLGLLLARAQYAAFQSIRDEFPRLSIDLDQYCALSALGAKPMTVEEIRELSRFYDRSFDDASLNALERRLLVERVLLGKVSKLRLTADGRRLVWQLLAIAKDSEATLLEQFDPLEGQWLKGALYHIGKATPTVAPDTSEGA